LYIWRQNENFRNVTIQKEVKTGPHDDGPELSDANEDHAALLAELVVVRPEMTLHRRLNLRSPSLQCVSRVLGAVSVVCASVS